MEHWLGIDAGGTKTLCLLADGDGRVLARGLAGPGNVTAAGREPAGAAMLAAIAAARAQVGPAELRGVCVAAAGVGLPEQRDWLLGFLRERLPGVAVAVVPDFVGAFAGALAGDAGAIVIAGTGSSAFAVHEDGRSARVGGYGRHLSDEGSGFWIVREAMAAALRAGDGRAPATALGPALLRAFELTQPEQFSRLQPDGAQWAARFPVVLEVAQDGDAVARELLARAGAELARLAAAALARAGFAGQSARVAPCGGALSTPGPHRLSFERELAMLHPGVRVVRPAGDGAEGALLCARRATLSAPLLRKLLP